MTIQHGIRCFDCKENLFSNSPGDVVTCQCGRTTIVMRIGQTRAHPAPFEPKLGFPITRLVPDKLPEHYRDERPLAR